MPLQLRCPACDQPLLADDEFCEACGGSLAATRDEPRHHLEIDRGLAAGVSDRGLVHQRNEDALYVEAVEGFAVAVVCDGVSTSAGSQVAAQLAAEVAGRALAGASTDPAGVTDGAGPRSLAVERAIAAADDAVRGVPWLDVGDRDAPSCTVVAGLWDGVEVAVGWVGDSRAYWVGRDGAQRLTLDHSWAQQQVDEGTMTVEEAESDRRAHGITRWLGADAPRGAAQVSVFRPGEPGWLILCTDGLWNYAASADALASLATGALREGPIVAARRLVRAALGRGGHDNVTVAVVEITPLEGGDE